MSEEAKKITRVVGSKKLRLRLNSKMVIQNRRLKVSEIAQDLVISDLRTSDIHIMDLGTKKVWVKSVLRILTLIKTTRE